MRKCILICLCFWGIVCLSSCDEESALTPSVQEIDWADSLDLSYAMVKDCYEKYGVGLITKFDPVRDMRYNIDTYWENLWLSRLERPMEVDSVLVFLEESFFCYFKNEEFVRTCFPRKILLSREILLSGTTNSYCSAMEESDARVGEKAINSLHSIYSKGAFAFSMKLGTIYYNQVNYRSYMMDNMYLFLSYLFEINDFYSVFGSDFYLSTMKDCYGRPFSGPATIYNGNKPGVYIEEGGSEEDVYTDKYWYWNKGFVSTAFMNPVIAPGSMDIIFLTSSISVFPDRTREVRSLINQMLFVTRPVWDSYPEVVKGRFAVLMSRFDEWGIDIRSMNPVMEYAFPRN